MGAWDGGGGGEVGGQLLMLSPKIPKLTFSQVGGWVGGGGGQLLMLSPKMLKSNIPIFTDGCMGGGGVGGQLLMLSPKMLKSKIHIFSRGGVWEPTFDAESKNAKI